MGLVPVGATSRHTTNPTTQVPTINRTDQTTDWFSSLQRCFNWSDRIDQKPLQPHDVDVQQALIRQYSNSVAGSQSGDVHGVAAAPVGNGAHMEWSGSFSGTHAVERWTAHRVVASSDSGQSTMDEA